jgi:hypothetical protein
MLEIAYINYQDRKRPVQRSIAMRGELVAGADRAVFRIDEHHGFERVV